METGRRAREGLWRCGGRTCTWWRPRELRHSALKSLGSEPRTSLMTGTSFTSCACSTKSVRPLPCSDDSSVDLALGVPWPQPKSCRGAAPRAPGWRPRAPYRSCCHCRSAPHRCPKRCCRKAGCARGPRQSGWSPQFSDEVLQTRPHCRTLEHPAFSVGSTTDGDVHRCVRI